MRKNVNYQTLYRKVSHVFLVVLLLIALCSCSSQKGTSSSHVYTNVSYDTIYGKWKTADGDILQLNEDGTYWRSGSRSEEGRYSEGSTIIPHGDFYQSYDYLQFQSNDFTSSPKTYYYILDGNHLEMSRYINKNDGTLDAERTDYYIKE